MTVLKTQTSSKARLKNDTLGDDALKKLYSGFNTMSDMQFMGLCIDTVQAGGGKQPTKDAIIAEIKKTKSRQTMLTKTQNFIMAGMGLGV